MEFQSLEFTVEDILLMHRDWITKLYVEERKTEVEIVEQLYERHLVVTCDPPFRSLYYYSNLNTDLAKSGNASQTGTWCHY
jgi:hypothetical protein